MSVHAQGLLRLHAGERLVNKIFGRRVPSHATGLALVMHHEHLAGLGPPATLTAIQAYLGHARTLAAFFALLRHAGFITAIPSRSDRRMHYLVPTPRLVQGLRQWLTEHARACEALQWLAPGTADSLREDDLLACCLARARPVLDHARTSAATGAWGWFDAFDCGDRIALKLLHTQYALTPQARAAGFVLPAREIAQQLGISVSHVRNVVNAALAAGLLQAPTPGHLMLSSRAETEIRRCLESFWRTLATTLQTALTAQAAFNARLAASDSRRTPSSRSGPPPSAPGSLPA